MLKNHPQVFSNFVRFVGLIITEQSHRSVVSGDKCRKNLKKCSFAAAIRSKDAKNFTLRHIKSHANQRLPITISVVEILDFNRMHFFHPLDDLQSPHKSMISIGRQKRRPYGKTK